MAHSLAASAALLLVDGCGGSGNGAPPPPPAPPAVSIAFSSAPPSTIPVAAAVGFTAVVSNTTNTEVTWTVTCGSSNQCGSFPIIEGSLDYASYNAPNDVPSGKTVTVTATSVADTTKSVTATMTVTAGIAFYNPVPAALQVNRTFQPWAVVGANSDTAPVQWTVTCSSSDCGSFNPAQSTSLGPSTYTAPGNVPAGGEVRITATSAEDPTQKVSAKVFIVPPAPALADGTYIFHLTNGTVLTSTTGAFTVQNGMVIGGEQDTNSFSTEVIGTSTFLPNPQFEQITGGTISTTSDGESQIVLTFTQGTGNVTGTETLTGELTADGKGFVPQLYGSVGNSALQLQTSVSSPAAGYAFAAHGLTPDNNWIWMGGVLDIDAPGSISGSGSVIDVEKSNPGGGLGQAIKPGTVSAPDAYGRVVVQFAGTVAPGNTSFSFAGYVIDSTHMFLEESSGDGFGGMLEGEAMGQGNNTGKFTAGSLAGSSYVFSLTGFSTTLGEYAAAGEFTANADGSVSGHLTWSAIPSSPAQPARDFTGSWKSDSTGRFILSDLTDRTSNTAATFDYNLQMYLSGDGHALLLNDDSNGTNLTGEAFEQQSGTLDAALLQGTFGLNVGQTYFNPPGTGGQVWTNTVYGPLAFSSGTGSVPVAGYGDSTVASTTVSLSGSFADQPNGSIEGTLTGMDPMDSSRSNDFSLYLIDSNRAILFETDAQVLTLGYLVRLQ